MMVKLFIIADNDEDFDRVCEEQNAQDYSPELLVSVSQLQDYNKVEVWDIRRLSRDLQEEEIEPLIM